MHWFTHSLTHTITLRSLIYQLTHSLICSLIAHALTHLLAQVSNQVGGEECFKERVDHYLVPCISQLAVAACKDSLWKLLNNHLLLKTRDTNAEVRTITGKFFNHVSAN